MPRKHRWIWIVLFIVAAVIVGSLAAGWNAVLVLDYYRMIELARDFVGPQKLQQSKPWLAVILGSLGFGATLAAVLIFFVRLLREMRLNQLQSEFLAAVTHELKTPIAALELTSGLIKSGDLPEKEIQSLWRSHDLELKRLRSEVETLLEAAKWQAGAVEQRPLEPVNLEDFIRDSMERWKKILGPGAELKREGELLNRRALLDVQNLRLATDNLIDNARKFSIGKPNVTIRTERFDSPDPRRAGRWKIQFVDQGLGFSEEDAKKIFNRFFRGKTPSFYAIPGTGLGLYLAYSAGRAMGVTLGGESPGLRKGASFSLEGPEILQKGAES